MSNKNKRKVVRDMYDGTNRWRIVRHVGHDGIVYYLEKAGRDCMGDPMWFQVRTDNSPPIMRDAMSVLLRDAALAVDPDAEEVQR